MPFLLMSQLWSNTLFCSTHTLLAALPSVALSLTSAFLFLREQREKEEIEKYRMERPKIQQQFSDLKVREKCLNCDLRACGRWMLFCVSLLRLCVLANKNSASR